MVLTQPTPNTPPLDDHGFIAAHAPCIKCRYDLRGLKPDGICPECGTSVAEAITGPLLRCEPLASITQLRTGLRFILGGYACLILAFVLGTLMSPIFSSGEPVVLIGLGYLLMCILQAAGIWKVVSFPATNLKSGRAILPVLARIAAVCMVFLTVVFLTLIMLVLVFVKPRVLPNTLGVGLVGLYGLGFGVTGASFCKYLARLMGGYGRHGLATASSYLAISFGLCGVFIVSAALVAVFEGTNRVPSPAILPWVLGWLLGVIGVFGILVFLPRVLRAVSGELTIAEGWASPRIGSPSCDPTTSGPRGGES